MYTVKAIGLLMFVITQVLLSEDKRSVHCPMPTTTVVLVNQLTIPLLDIDSRVRTKIYIEVYRSTII
jgi:hypothetical protein